jgi:Recombination endonuclease VII.
MSNEPITKVCPKCGEAKDASHFYIQKSGRRAGQLTCWCKSCCSKQSAKRYKDFPDKCKEEHAKWVANNKEKVAFTKAKSAYGITREEYDNLLNVCQICGSVDNLVIDHSHQSGRIRGMLCHSCNKALGFFRDNPVYAARASDYLLGVHEEIKPDIFTATYELAEGEIV